MFGKNVVHILQNGSLYKAAYNMCSQLYELIVIIYTNLIFILLSLFWGKDSSLWIALLSLYLCILLSVSTCFINSSHQSGICMCIPPFFVARQPLCKQVPIATHTRNNRRVVSYPVHVISSDSVGLLVYTLIVDRQRLANHISAARKNLWRRLFLCGPWLMKGK
jgi:hypothetical protein